MGPSTPFSSWQTLSVVADIMCDMANISRFMAGIMHGMAIILRGVHEIFHVKGKNALFQKYSKIGLVAKILMITIRGGGFRPKSNQDYFFKIFILNPSLTDVNLRE